MTKTVTITLSIEERNTVVFALNRAITSFLNEYDRTSNPRAKIHAESTTRVGTAIVDQTADAVAEARR